MFLYWLQICVLLIIFRSAQAALARYVTADVNFASISPSSILQDGGNESSFPSKIEGRLWKFLDTRKGRSEKIRGAPKICMLQNQQEDGGLQTNWTTSEGGCCDSAAPLPIHDVTDIKLKSYLGKSRFCVVCQYALCTLPKRPNLSRLDLLFKAYWWWILSMENRS